MALEIYLSAINNSGQPSPGWERFERELAYQFALLLRFLVGLPKTNERVRLLKLFLDGLNLSNKRGRTLKAREQLREAYHGRRMDELWNEEIQFAWNMKVSLGRTEKDARAFLQKRGVADDIVNAVCSLKATPESSLARVYSRRTKITYGRARNVLRAYMKANKRKFGAQL